MASVFGLSVEALLENETLKLTVFDDDSVDAVIRLLKIKKPGLLNKEIDYIKGIVKRTIKFNEIMKKQSEPTSSNVIPNMNQKQIAISESNYKNDSFFRYKVLDDLSDLDLDPDADLIPNSKWQGLTVNLVVDIYGIFKAMKYGTAQREDYSKIDFLRDIESAESKILRDDAVSSLVEEIDIESAVSFHPQYVIKDDLFETVNPLLAMSLVLNKLESEQIGNGIKIKCVVVPALITSIYDETKEFESKIKSVAEYLEQRVPANVRILNETINILDDIPKTAEILKEMLDIILFRPTRLSASSSGASTIFTIFNRKLHGVSSHSVAVHVFCMENQKVQALCGLDHNYFVGMEMSVIPCQEIESKSPSAPFRRVQCWLRFGIAERIRFVVEQLVWILPILFGRSAEMKPYAFWSRVYGDDYKHRWSVSLKDDILSKFHHILTGNVLCSVNYHRGEVHHEDGELVDGLRDHLERTLDVVLMEKMETLISAQRYDSDAVVEDVMVMVTEPKRTNEIDSNICRQLDGPKSKAFRQLKQAVISYLKIGCDANVKLDIADCPLIENMIQNLIRFKQFGLEIDASNLFEFTLSPLVKGLDHLYRVHEYGVTSGPNRQSIRRHVLQHVRCHLGADCPIVQQHGDRKRENDRRRVDRQKEAKQPHDDGNDSDDAPLGPRSVGGEIDTQCEALRDTLCAAHSYLLHDNDELYRLRLAAAELRFATEVVAEDTEQKEDEVKRDEEDEEDPLSINYGESVLEWLSFDESPQFDSLREELIYNEDSTLDRDLLSRMTVQCVAAIQDTDYTLKEALGLKTYADATAFQSELRKAHWKGRALALKRAYFHWAMTLYEAHLYHSKPVPAVSGKPKGVYHGLNRLFTMNRELPIYLGPFSVSTSKTVAKQFSNEKGLLFSISPSYVNPFKFSVGIDMLTFSSFKNEAEVLFNNQPIPIKKTETFGDAMVRLVDHFLFSLKNRKTRINDVDAFYQKLGVDWNDEWIPIILEHKLLFKKTQYPDGRKIIDRLLAELNILDQRLVELVLDMVHDDSRPYVVYLVEDLKTKHLLQHYRMMTSGFTVQHYCHVINCSWLKWQANNKMNDVLGVKDVDDSCFGNAKYRVNDQPASLKTCFLADTIRSVTVRYRPLFAERLISIYAQKVEEISEADNVPYNAGGLLRIDQYTNNFIVVDDIPSESQHFRLRQKVKCFDESIGEISRVTANGVCIKMCNDDMIVFRWIDRAQYSMKLTLDLDSQKSSLEDYEFAAVEGQDDRSDSLLATAFKFDNLRKFALPHRSIGSFVSVYVRRKEKTDRKWGRMALLNLSRNDEVEISTKLLSSTVDMVEQLLLNLLKTSIEIIEAHKFYELCGLKLDQCVEWMPIITKHPLLFAVTRYRRKLVIERLIVELKLWSFDWVHRIFEEKLKDKPMIQWLVEERKIVKLRDHYRVFMSIKDIHSSQLLNRRWLTWQKTTEKIGTAEFGKLDNECFDKTKWSADGVSFEYNIPEVSGEVKEITATNTKLFGDRPAVIRKFERKNEDDYESDDFVGALRFDGENVFLNPIPASQYSFCFGQEVECIDGAIGKVSRVTSDAVCIKFGNDSILSYRWIQRCKIPMELKLKFRYRSEMTKYRFVVTVGPTDATYISDEQSRRFSNVEALDIPCKSLNAGAEHEMFIYAKPKTDKYKWICLGPVMCQTDIIRSMVSMSDTNLEHGHRGAVHRLFCWLREWSHRVDDTDDVLNQFGLQKEKISEWMPAVLAHPLLMKTTAYRWRLCVERIIMEFSLVNTEIILYIIDKSHGGKKMLDRLVEDLGDKTLYDHYRALSSGWRVTLHSALLKRTWMNFERSTKMEKNDDFKDADDSLLNKTVYMIGDVAYPMNTTVSSLCVMNVPRQTCQNAALFGDNDVSIHLSCFLKPIPSAVNKAARDHMSWFQQEVKSKTVQPLELTLFRHRGHFSNFDPSNLLVPGRAKYYINYENGPITEDWIIFELHTQDSIPTEIAIVNGTGRESLKQISIFGSADNETFEEWITIPHILRTNDLQRFQIHPTSVYLAWIRGFRYFRLCSMDNYEAEYIAFYELVISGICRQSATAKDFVDSLRIGKDYELFVDPDFGSDSKVIEVEVKVDGKWIGGVISRRNADKICVKWLHGIMNSYRWFPKDGKTQILRLPISHRNQIPEHIFAVCAGNDDASFSWHQMKEFIFDSEEEFVIPLHKVMAFSSTPDTIFIYAKPKNGKHEFELIKRIKCDQLIYSTFIVNDAMYINQEVVINFGGKFEVRATSDIIVAETGHVSVSCCGSTTANTDLQRQSVVVKYQDSVRDVESGAVPVIHLISGANVLNEGFLLCGASDDEKADGGTVCIDANGAFHNRGTINCGDDGIVHITCTEFENNGVIFPIPTVTLKDKNKERNKVFKMSRRESKCVSLEIYTHRGNYGSRHPKGLLLEGMGDHYDSDGKGPPEEDWIVFKSVSKKRIFPTNIMIRNYNGGYGLKTIKIDGSMDGVVFEDWIEIKNISRENNDLQQFDLDFVVGYFAWERAYTYFKLNVVQNHGHSYNMFYEFRINGVSEE